MNKDQDITKSVNAMLEHLNDPTVRVRSDLMDDIVSFKHILYAIANRQLILASPERIIPADKPQPVTDKGEVND